LGNDGGIQSNDTNGITTRLSYRPRDGIEGAFNLVPESIMQLEALQQAGAEPYQRIDGRKAHRNGYKKRSLKTRVGEITLDKPQLRELSFETRVLINTLWTEPLLVDRWLSNTI
jgi:transposase-like protein